MSKGTMAVVVGVLALAVTLLSTSLPARADKFTAQDQERWMQEYQSVVQQGRALWTSPTLGTNGVACAQCHPNGANTHFETYPKFQKQLGKVATLREMINWCLQHPVEGKALAQDDPRMIAMEAYLAWERRGVALAPGKH